MEATVQERQQLAAKLKQVSVCNAFIYQAGVLRRQQLELPDIPAFGEGQIAVAESGSPLTSAADCTALTSVPGTDGNAMSFAAWRKLVDKYFHDMRLPLSPLPSAEDAFKLTGELVTRDAVAQSLSHARARRSELDGMAANYSNKLRQRYARHRAEVNPQIAQLEKWNEGARKRLGGLQDLARAESSRNSILEKLFNLYNHGLGCFVTFLITIASLDHFMKNHADEGFMLGLGFHLFIVPTLCYLIGGFILAIFRGNRRNKDSDKLAGQIAQNSQRAAELDAEPAWFTSGKKELAGIRKRLGVVEATCNNLAPYEWPLDADECRTLAQVTSDISADARSWRELNVRTIDAAVSAARTQLTQTSNAINLMPNAVGDALVLAKIVEDGYADNVKEAMNYMATDRYRSSNLGLQAAQLKQLEMTRMENARYMRRLMSQLTDMSVQLMSIDAGIDGVASRVDETNRRLGGISDQLDGISEGVWATAAAAREAAANSAAAATNTATTAANTARIAESVSRIERNNGSYQAARTAYANATMRNFYA